MTRQIVIRMAREKRLTIRVRGREIDADPMFPLNRDEAAAVLDITPDHLSRLTTAGDVPAHYNGKRPMYFRDELNDWLRSR